MKTIRLLAADDHALLREGIAALVNAQPDMEVVAYASTGREAIERFRVHQPDITLMDLQMPDMGGIEAMIAIRGAFPNARIIVLTTYSGDMQVLRALRAGARGYLLKGNIHTELLDAIRAVHAGHRRVPAEVAAELAGHAGEEELTGREIEVLRLIAKGKANKEIAAQLSVTEETVSITHILGKLGANGRTHAVTICLHRGSSSCNPPKVGSSIWRIDRCGQCVSLASFQGGCCSGSFPHLRTAGLAQAC